MKKVTNRKPRILREEVAPKLLAQIQSELTGYGKGRAFSKKTKLTYQTLYVIKKTGKATKSDIQKIQKVLKAA